MSVTVPPAPRRTGPAPGWPAPTTPADPTVFEAFDDASSAGSAFAVSVLSAVFGSTGAGFGFGATIVAGMTLEGPGTYAAMLPLGAPADATRTGLDLTCVITPNSMACISAATMSVEPLCLGSTGADASAKTKSVTHQIRARSLPAWLSRASADRAIPAGKQGGCRGWTEVCGPSCAASDESVAAGPANAQFRYRVAKASAARHRARFHTAGRRHRDAQEVHPRIPTPESRITSPTYDVRVITLIPIGTVRSSRADLADDDWDAVRARIELAADFDANALDGLEYFSHAEIIFHFDRGDESK